MTDGDFSLEARWRLGHRAFDVILAGLNEIITVAIQKISADDFGGMSTSLETVVVLLESATSAMHFAADFDAATYQNRVRPTMAPPHMPPGFSGTLNERHAEFLQKFRGLDAALKARFGNRLENAPPDIGTAWRAVLKMRSKNLAAHGLVCERFVPGGQSLLKEHFRSKEEKS